MRCLTRHVLHRCRLLDLCERVAIATVEPESVRAEGDNSDWLAFLPK
jgi:hypothetical protein